MTSVMQMQQTAARDQVIEGFIEVLDLTGDVRDALEAVGRSYESMRRTLKGAGYDELVAKLSAWKEQDTERLRYALGRQWQGERV